MYPLNQIRQHSIRRIVKPLHGIKADIHVWRQQVKIKPDAVTAIPTLYPGGCSLYIRKVTVGRLLPPGRMYKRIILQPGALPAHMQDPINIGFNWRRYFHDVHLKRYGAEQLRWYGNWKIEPYDSFTGIELMYRGKAKTATACSISDLPQMRYIRRLEIPCWPDTWVGCCRLGKWKRWTRIRSLLRFMKCPAFMDGFHGRIPGLLWLYPHCINLYTCPYRAKACSITLTIL